MPAGFAASGCTRRGCCQNHPPGAGLTARLGEVQKARAEYSSRYCVDRNWKAVVEGCLDMQSLTREMVEAFVDKVAVHEGGDVEVYLKYDDVLEDLLRIRAEREAV